MVKNLSPQDSRIVELCSAYALILLSITSVTSGFDMPELLHIATKLEWTILLALFGGLQFYSLFNYPKVEPLRLVLGWCAGCFWLYAGMLTSLESISAEDIASVMLGIGNLYGFVVNFNLLKVSWKQSL